MATEPRECNVTLNVSECSKSGKFRTCLPCGNVVCVECSEIVKAYLKHRRVGVCNDCMTDHAEDVRRYPQWRPEFNDALLLAALGDTDR